MLGEVCGLWYLRPLRTDTPTHRGQAEGPWRPSQGMGTGWAATTQKAPGKTPGRKRSTGTLVHPSWGTTGSGQICPSVTCSQNGPQMTARRRKLVSRPGPHPPREPLVDRAAVGACLAKVPLGHSVFT